MCELPAELNTYLCNFIANHHSPAYVLLNQAGVVVEFGGDLARYGLQDLRPGDLGVETLVFLEGFLPLQDSPVFLPFVKQAQQASANVHIFSGERGDWVLFLDAEDEESQRQNMQKPGNVFSLMRSQELKLRRLTVSQGKMQTHSPLQAQSECVVFCANVSFAMDRADPSIPPVSQSLDRYLSVMGEAIWSESGIITAWLGDLIIATFGLLPTHQPPQQHAFEAGIRILERTHSTQATLSGPSATLGVGIMIRTELLLSHNLNVSAPTVVFNLLASKIPVFIQAMTHIAPDEILIDANTLKHLGEQRQFQALSLPDHLGLGPTYSYRF